MGFNAILKTKRVYMLYLLPFILAAIAFLRFTFGPEDFSVCLDLGVISIPDFQEQGGLWWKEIGVLALLCLSFLVFFVADRYQFLSHITVLPAVIYALLCIGVICRYGMSNYLVAALCVVLAVARLQSAIVNTQSNAPVFGFGLFSTLAVLLCPKLIHADRLGNHRPAFFGKGGVEGFGGAVYRDLFCIIFHGMLLLPDGSVGNITGCIRAGIDKRASVLENNA